MNSSRLDINKYQNKTVYHPAMKAKLDNTKAKSRENNDECMSKETKILLSLVGLAILGGTIYYGGKKGWFGDNVKKFFNGGDNNNKGPGGTDNKPKPPGNDTKTPPPPVKKSTVTEIEGKVTLTTANNKVYTVNSETKIILDKDGNPVDDITSLISDNADDEVTKYIKANCIVKKDDTGVFKLAKKQEPLTGQGYYYEEANRKWMLGDFKDGIHDECIIYDTNGKTIGLYLDGEYYDYARAFKEHNELFPENVPKTPDSAVLKLGKGKQNNEEVIRILYFEYNDNNNNRVIRLLNDTVEIRFLPNKSVAVEDYSNNHIVIFNSDKIDFCQEDKVNINSAYRNFYNITHNETNATFSIDTNGNIISYKGKTNNESSPIMQIDVERFSFKIPNASCFFSNLNNKNPKLHYKLGDGSSLNTPVKNLSTEKINTVVPFITRNGKIDNDMITLKHVPRKDIIIDQEYHTKDGGTYTLTKITNPDTVQYQLTQTIGPYTRTKIYSSEEFQQGIYIAELNDDVIITEKTFSEIITGYCQNEADDAMETINDMRAMYDNIITLFKK